MKKEEMKSAEIKIPIFYHKFDEWVFIKIIRPLFDSIKNKKTNDSTYTSYEDTFVIRRNFFDKSSVDKSFQWLMGCDKYYALSQEFLDLYFNNSYPLFSEKAKIITKESIIDPLPSLEENQTNIFYQVHNYLFDGFLYFENMRIPKTFLLTFRGCPTSKIDQAINFLSQNKQVIKIENSSPDENGNTTISFIYLPTNEEFAKLPALENKSHVAQEKFFQQQVLWLKQMIRLDKLEEDMEYGIRLENGSCLILND